MKLVHVTTVPGSLGFVRGQVGYMKRQGFHITVVSSPGEKLEEFAKTEKVDSIAVDMPRRITPVHDLIALYRLWRTLKCIRPDVIHAHTPKGGLLGILGGWLARVPIRIYHIHGLPYMTAQGYKRTLLIITEKVACMFSHQVLCVSNSIRKFAISDGICSANKIKVLGNGSIDGVDASDRFNPKQFTKEERASVRLKYGIAADAVVLGFVGRIVKDKGIVELWTAWQQLKREYSKLALLVVGRIETQNPVPNDIIMALESDPRVRMIGQQSDMPPFYAALDILACPTYREGFGLVAIEASSMMLPVVATRIPGCVDAVQDGVTGTLVPARNAQALAAAIKQYLDDPDLRRKHGKAGRERVLRDFRPEDIWEAVYQEYVCLLQAKGLDVPKNTTARSEVSAHR